MFIGIRKVLSSLNFVQEETIYIYRRITLIVAFYWGVMAIIRLYLYFNIYKHSEIISSAGQMTTGSVCIALIFIYLTAKKWFKK